MKSTTLANVLTGTLTLCAVLVTGAVVRREFFSPQPAAASGFPTPRQIGGGAEYAKEGNVMGAANAPIRIVEFSDFECPFCHDMAATLDTLRQRYPGQVAVVYRHYPVRIHHLAMPAAIAAECAAAQGRFEAYHNILFASQDTLGMTTWERLAVLAGVPDTARFHQCRGEPWPRQHIERDMAAAKAVDVGGTPTILVDNFVRGSALPLDSLEAWLKSLHPELARQ